MPRPYRSACAAAWDPQPWREFVWQLRGEAEHLRPDDGDSAAGIPKSTVLDPAFDWGDDRPPGVPWNETIVYEVHVKGMTAQHPEVPESQRGTYAGVASEPVITHLKRLGITTVELLPVHSFRQRQLPPREGTDQLLRLQLHRLFRAGIALLVVRPAKAARASKSSSTWCTTTGPKATIWATASRPCGFQSACATPRTGAMSGPTCGRRGGSRSGSVRARGAAATTTATPADRPALSPGSGNKIAPYEGHDRDSPRHSIGL